MRRQRLPLLGASATARLGHPPAPARAALSTRTEAGKEEEGGRGEEGEEGGKGRSRPRRGSPGSRHRGLGVRVPPYTPSCSLLPVTPPPSSVCPSGSLLLLVQGA